MPQKPASKIDAHWPIVATIWRNDSGGRVWYSATIERSYRDGEGKSGWTSTFSNDELLVLAKVADLAHSEVARLRRADREAQQSEEQRDDA